MASFSCGISRRPRVKNTRILRERIEKFISPIYFADVNLYSRLYGYTERIESLHHYQAPGIISYEEAVAKEDEYEVVSVGNSFGPTWSTHWFYIDVDLMKKENWREQEIRLRWNSSTEAMVWLNGIPMQGLTGGDGQVRTDFILSSCCKGNESFRVYIEMAANGMFGAGKGGMIQPTDPNKYFQLSMVEISAVDKYVYSLIRDLKMIVDISETLEDSELAQRSLQIGCDVVNSYQIDSKLADSHEKSKIMLDGLFGTTRSIEHNDSYTVHAIGHCHIDSAWLWPYAETERKCGRSWSSVIGLMERYPEFNFACSQAVQFEWVKVKYPSLYKKIKKYASLGRFIPTGGTWVEMDGNIPSGESFVRQFLYGQKFFKKEFGAYCDVFWLPDTFGYSAQLPQIMTQAGIKYFLTQKISWSLINKFPHNTFIWEGIDGSRCLAHFPPADTYESSASMKDILKTRDQNKEKGIVSDGMLLYGFGDGGGGPTEDMIENLNRIGVVKEIPRVQHSTPTTLFSTLEKSSHLLHTWVGELYLELHQGTFTTQALVKRKNRQCEMRLRNTEFFQVLAYLKSNGTREKFSPLRIQHLWKKVLLNQFHDVLPGTSINEVFKDAQKLYKEVETECFLLDNKYMDITLKIEFLALSNNGVVFNTSCWPRKCLFLTNSDSIVIREAMKQTIYPLNGNSLSAVLVDIPSMGFRDLDRNVTCNDHLAIHQDSGSGMIILSNKNLSAKFNSSGQMLSCILTETKRECISANTVGNEFCMYTDIPLYWDAWDVMPYNNESRIEMNNCTEICILDRGPLRVSFKFTLKLSVDSSLTQIVSLDAESKFLRFDTQVNWNENRKILKVEFPFDVHTNHATYDIQYGYIQRPTHCNTSWDWAKYEVCGHKWVDVSEFGFGVALLNDCKYGFSVYGSTVQMSLLRSPKAPDEYADMGDHLFSYAIMPYSGSFQSAGVIREAYDFNNPLQFIDSPYREGATFSLFQVDNPAVILDAVKMSEEDTSRDSIVIRLYESFGSRAAVKVSSEYIISDVYRINLLEDILTPSHVKLVSSKTFTFNMKPFELLSLMVIF